MPIYQYNFIKIALPHLSVSSFTWAGLCQANTRGLIDWDRREPNLTLAPKEVSTYYRVTSVSSCQSQCPSPFIIFIFHSWDKGNKVALVQIRILQRAEILNPDLLTIEASTMPTLALHLWTLATLPCLAVPLICDRDYCSVSFYHTTTAPRFRLHRYIPYARTPFLLIPTVRPPCRTFFIPSPSSPSCLPRSSSSPGPTGSLTSSICDPDSPAPTTSTRDFPTASPVTSRLVCPAATLICQKTSSLAIRAPVSTMRPSLRFWLSWRRGEWISIRRGRCIWRTDSRPMVLALMVFRGIRSLWASLKTHRCMDEIDVVSSAPRRYPIIIRFWSSLYESWCYERQPKTIHKICLDWTQFDLRNNLTLAHQLHFPIPLDYTVTLLCYAFSFCLYLFR